MTVLNISDVFEYYYFIFIPSSHHHHCKRQTKFSTFLILSSNTKLYTWGTKLFAYIFNACISMHKNIFYQVKFDSVYVVLFSYSFFFWETWWSNKCDHKTYYFVCTHVVMLFENLVFEWKFCVFPFYKTRERA